MKIAVVTGASSGMGRETIIQLWEHFKGFDEIWIIARRRERLDELDRQVGVPLRKFALDLTRERDRDVLLRALSARKPQVKFLVNAAGFGMIGQVEELGFNVVSYANNHMYDKGSAGLAESKRVFDALPSVTVAGIYERGSYDDIPIREENGIRFAFLSYMEMTNVGSSGDTCGIYLKDEETIRRQMELARQQADFIVVNVHWGAEGSDTPNAYQKEEAQKLADWGADLILGHHPHVLQPIAELTAADGRQVPVIYSLGNFVSAQKGNYNMAGGFLDCTVVLDMKTGETRVEGLSFIPTVTQFGSRFSNLHIVPFSDWSESQAAAHGLAGNGFSYQFVKRQLENTFGNYLKTGA